MKNFRIVLLTLALTALACTLPGIVQTPPTPPEIPTWTPQSPTQTEVPASPTAPPAATEPGMTVPPEVASGFSVEEMPVNVDGDPWGIAPAYIRFNLQNYALYDTFHQPRVYIYPVDEFIELSEGAAINIKRLQDVLGAPDPAQVTASDLPGVTFFNAATIFASNVQFVKFQNGSGVRFLTEYAQYFAP